MNMLRETAAAERESPLVHFVHVVFPAGPGSEPPASPLGFSESEEVDEAC